MGHRSENDKERFEESEIAPKPRKKKNAHKMLVSIVYGVGTERYNNLDKLKALLGAAMKIIGVVFLVNAFAVDIVIQLKTRIKIRGEKDVWI